MKYLTKVTYLFAFLSIASSASQKNSNSNPGVHDLKVTLDDQLNNNLKDFPDLIPGGSDGLGNDTISITVNGASVTGNIIFTHNEKEIYSFQGIPYVDMPDRYKWSTAAKLLKDDFDATSMGSQCLQASKRRTNGASFAVGKEDCLFINVYTPVNPNKENIKLPVMVYIHGGQFVSGDASTYMPTRLLDEDVVLVTFHYRLGALGFYYIGSGNSEYPGNLALWDQHYALQWVNQHIEYFGGDKNQVTLFGQDAGAVSALYQLITGKTKYKDQDSNNEEKKLFHAVIAQSGSPLDPFGFADQDDPWKTDLEEILGCSGDQTAIGKCMLDASTDELALAVDKMAQNRPFRFPYLAPRIDENSMVMKAPLTLLEEGQYDPLPLMLGSCAQEGSFFFGVFYTYYLSPENKITDEEYLKYEMVPDLVSLSGISDPLEFVSSSLYETYLKDVDRTNFADITPGMIDMSGALFDKAGILQTAKLSYNNYHREGGIGGGETNDADIFLYSFEYKGEQSMFPLHFWGVEEPEFTDEEIGVTHGDELFYLLAMSSLTNKDDERTMETMIKMWANFATEHNPTPTSLGGGGGGEWKSFSDTKQEYLSIALELDAREGYEDRYTILVDDDETDNGGWPDINFTLPTLPFTPTVPTELPSTTIPPPFVLPDKRCSCTALYDAEDEREAYMITMIVFIIFFVMALGFAAYSYSLSRN